MIRADLGLDPDEIVVCGMSLGYADPEAPENGLETERVQARLFTRFMGFAENSGANDPSIAQEQAHTG